MLIVYLFNYIWCTSYYCTLPGLLKKEFSVEGEKVVEGVRSSARWPLVWKTWKHREFDSCQGNVRKLVKSQRSFEEKPCLGKPFIGNLMYQSLVASYMHVYYVKNDLHDTTWIGLQWIVREMWRNSRLSYGQNTCDNCVVC